MIGCLSQARMVYLVFFPCGKSGVKVEAYSSIAHFLIVGPRHDFVISHDSAGWCPNCTICRFNSTACVCYLTEYWWYVGYHTNSILSSTKQRRVLLEHDVSALHMETQSAPLFHCVWESKRDTFNQLIIYFVQKNWILWDMFSSRNRGGSNSPSTYRISRYWK